MRIYTKLCACCTLSVYLVTYNGVDTFRGHVLRLPLCVCVCGGYSLVRCEVAIVYTFCIGYGLFYTEVISDRLRQKCPNSVTMYIPFATDSNRISSCSRVFVAGSASSFRKFINGW